MANRPIVVGYSKESTRYFVEDQEHSHGYALDLPLVSHGSF
jgi:hypothetical protein